MSHENGPTQNVHCPKTALLPSVKDRCFKIHFSDRITHAVCYEHPVSHFKIPIFWIVLWDKYRVRILFKNAHLHDIGIIVPKHKPEPHTEGYDTTFIEDVLSWLGEAGEKGCFGRIILSSPPKMLGEIRKHMPENLASYIIAQLDKDLTKLNEPELKRELSEILWFA